MGLHFYWIFFLPGTNVATFIPSGGSARYKCEANTYFVSGRATTRYKCEAFVPGWLEEAPTRPCEGTFESGGGSSRYECPHLTGTNALICTEGKNTRYK
jgi:hypothetical protein